MATKVTFSTAEMDVGKTLAGIHRAQELYQLLNHADGASKASLKLDWGDVESSTKQVRHQIGFLVASSSHRRCEM